MYLFRWILTLNCNFNCSYCIQTNRPIRPTDTNFDRLISFSKHINRLTQQEEDNFRLLLVGGEVTLIPLNIMLTLLDNVYSEKMEQLNIISNFSAKEEYYIEIAKWCSNHNIKFILTGSFHEEFIKQEVYMRKAVAIRPFVKELKCEFVKTKLNENLIEGIISDCKKYNLDYRIDNNRKQKWEESEIDNSTNINKFRFMVDPYGMNCSGYKYTTTLDYDGRIYGLRCRTDRESYGYINLVKKLKRDEIICTCHSCPVCAKFILKDTKGNEVINTFNPRKEKK